MQERVLWLVCPFGHRSEALLVEPVEVRVDIELRSFCPNCNNQELEATVGLAEFVKMATQHGDDVYIVATYTGGSDGQTH